MNAQIKENPNVVEKSESRIILKPIKEIDVSVLFKMLDKVGFYILKTLFHTDYSLDARNIHYNVVRFYVMEEFFPPEEEKTLKTSKYEKTKYASLLKESQKNRSKWIKEMSKTYKVPSYNLIVSSLDGLVRDGIIGKRTLVGRKAVAHYFINPKLYEVIKRGNKPETFFKEPYPDL